MIVCSAGPGWPKVGGQGRKDYALVQGLALTTFSAPTKERREPAERRMQKGHRIPIVKSPVAFRNLIGDPPC
jgi:hypothetical protein